jgi:hypothetical protein
MHTVLIHTCKQDTYKIAENSRAVLAQDFNPSTREVEAGRFLSSRPAWSQGYTEKPCVEKPKKLKKKKKLNSRFPTPGKHSISAVAPAF